MEHLALSTPGLADLCLLGAPSLSAIRRAAFTPRDGEIDAVVDETVRLELAGTPAEIGAACCALEQRLERLREGRYRGNTPSTLTITPRPGEPPWVSPLVDGWQVASGADRARGSLNLELRLRRENHWEAGERSAPLSNRGGERLTGGIEVWNHRDSAAGHDNWVSIDAADIEGDLPTPLRLELLDITGAAPGNRDLIVAQSIYDCPPSPGAVIECGGAASAACSNGDYAPLSAGGEARMLVADLEAAFALAAGGTFVKPLLKLTGGPDAADVWLKARLAGADGVILHDPTYTLAAVDDPLVELGAVRLPNRPEGGAPAGLRVELWGKKAAGSLAINIDYLLLAPMDGYRRYSALPNADWQSACLVDDGRGRVYRQDAGGGNIAAVFTASGSPLRLVPGRGCALTFQLAGPSGTAIDRRCRVTARYRPRKRRV